MTTPPTTPFPHAVLRDASDALALLDRVLRGIEHLIGDPRIVEDYAARLAQDREDVTALVEWAQTQVVRRWERTGPCQKRVRYVAARSQADTAAAADEAAAHAAGTLSATSRYHWRTWSQARDRRKTA